MNDAGGTDAGGDEGMLRLLGDVLGDYVCPVHCDRARLGVSYKNYLPKSGRPGGSVSAPIREYIKYGPMIRKRNGKRRQGPILLIVRRADEVLRLRRSERNQGRPQDGRRPRDSLHHPHHRPACVHPCELSGTGASPLFS